MIHYVLSVRSSSDRLYLSYSFQSPSLHNSLFYSPSPSPYDPSVPISPSTSASACPALIPRISIARWSHHFLDSHIPGFLSVTRHKSMIVWVAIYCATVLWMQSIYTPISSSPTIVRSVPMGGYTHDSSHWRLGTMPAICCTSFCWKPLSTFSIWEIITQVSDPNRSTACTTAT